MHDETSCIKMMKNGDSSGLRGIMDLYQDFVYTILRSMLKSEMDAEEASQDTFIKAYRGIKRFNGGSKFSTWLYRIAYRTGLDYIKKRKPPIQLDLKVHEILEGSDEKQIENAELTEYLLNAINRLKPTDAAVLRLFYFRELSLKEIGEIVGMNESAVKVRLYRSRKILRSRIEKTIHWYQPSIKEP